MRADLIIFHSEARAEIRSANRWYRQRSKRAAEGFIEEIERALNNVLSAPQRWPKSKGGWRRFPLFRFPYSIIYREKTTNEIEVIAVAHARRRPRYWETRTFPEPPDYEDVS